MSFIIRGGYDIFRKQVLNIALKPTNKWVQGVVMIKDYNYVSHLGPLHVNNLEMVKYNQMHALLLNDNIIYEDEKLFNYKLELHGFRDPILSDPKLYDFIDCNYVEAYALKHVGRWRELN